MPFSKGKTNDVQEVLKITWLILSLAFVNFLVKL